MKETTLKNLEQKFKFLGSLALIIFGLLMIRLWILQIMQGATIMVKSKENQTRVIRMNAPRGIYYDRNDQIMVSSRISHNISVVPEDIKDKPEVIALLSKLLNISEAEIREKIKPDPKRPRAPYQYIPIIKDVDPATALKVYEAKLDLPGVEVDEVPVRSYLNGEFASHLFGYIREINDEELVKMKDKGYRLGDLVGKTGLERTYEDYLRGIDGGKIFEVDIKGRPLRLLENKEPVPGNNLYLTIDQKVQAAAEKALEEQLLYIQKYTKFKNAKAGAVVALDPRNGNILAMVSKPAFDPNLFVGVIPADVAQKLYNNPLHPFNNRVVQGEFAPGSTFKPITVYSALMENKATEKDKFYCGGIDPVWGNRFKCWILSDKGRIHGSQNIIEGLKNSCNIVMAELSRRVGPDNLAKYSRFFGLGSPTGFNLYPGERLGLVPDTEWKQKNTRDKEWYPLETLHFGIGQGYLTVTPLQLAQVYQAIANNGKVYVPQVVSKITSPSGEEIKKFKPRLSADLKISREYNSIIQEGLTEVVDEGTAAWVFQGFPLDKYPVAGKTGTVQKPPYDNSGVFACYAPANDPQIVVVVFVEQGGSGSGGAAPVARKILESYFNLDQIPKPQATKKVAPTPETTGTVTEGATNVLENGETKVAPKKDVPAKPTPGTSVLTKPEVGTSNNNTNNINNNNGANSNSSTLPTAPVPPAEQRNQEIKPKETEKPVVSGNN